MSATRPAQQRRSTLCRMAGNIAAGVVSTWDGDRVDTDEIVNVSVDLAERIYDRILERYPDEEAEP